MRPDHLVARGARVTDPRATAPAGTRAAITAPASHVELVRDALRAHAEGGQPLGTGGVGRALTQVEQALVGSGVPAGEAPTRARTLVLEALGVGEGGATHHTVDTSEAVQLAYHFGSPLAQHERNLADHFRTRFVAEARQSAVALAQRAEPGGDLARELTGARSFTELATVLQRRGQLATYLPALEAGSTPPFQGVFARLADGDAAGLRERVAALDNLRVAVADVDGDGRIGARDVLALHVSGSGLFAEVGETLADQLAVARGMQAAVSQITDRDGRSRFRFALFPPEVSATHFELQPNEAGMRTIFRLRDGASASAALDDMVANAERYGFECNSAIQVAWHVGQLHVYRERFGAEADARFDRDFARMTIGPDGDTSLTLTRLQTPSLPAPIPGDHLYFNNPAADRWGRANGWQGENVVYVGRGANGEPQYYGHPFGLTTEATIVEHLQSQAERIERAGARHAVGELERATRLRLAAVARSSKDDPARAVARELTERLALIARVRGGVAEVERTARRANEATRAYDDALTRIARGDRAVTDARVRALFRRAEANDRAFDAAGEHTIALVRELESSLRRELTLDPSAASSVTAARAALRRIEARSPGLDEDGTRMSLHASATTLR